MNEIDTTVLIEQAAIDAESYMKNIGEHEAHMLMYEGSPEEFSWAMSNDDVFDVHVTTDGGSLNVEYELDDRLSDDIKNIFEENFEKLIEKIDEVIAESVENNVDLISDQIADYVGELIQNTIGGEGR